MACVGSGVALSADRARPAAAYREVWEGHAQSEGRALRLECCSLRQFFAIGSEPEMGEGRLLMSTASQPERQHLPPLQAFE
jgi:hypothetical protein